LIAQIDVEVAWLGHGSTSLAPELEDPDDSGGFAPTDLTDGRSPGEWTTRWTDKNARRSIHFEAAYLSILLLAVPVGTMAVWLRWPADVFDGIEKRGYETFAVFSYAVIGGILGGTLFDIKWLYHTVAHGSWNRDRRLWRLMTPFIAGGLAFGMILLGTADLVPLLDSNELRQPRSAMGISFLIGYFSDNTIGAMARLANGLFGEREPVKSHHLVGGESTPKQPAP
jgi:hypothetical protein